MKNKKFKEYVEKLIKEFPELFDEFNQIMEDVLGGPEELVEEICNFSNMLDKNYFNQEIVTKFKAHLRKNEYSEAYYLVLNEYLYANMSITVTCKLDLKKFSRHFMIPLRCDIADFISIILGSFRLNDFDHAFLICGNFIYSATLNEPGILNGKGYLIQNLIFYNNIRLCLGKYTFDIRIRKNKYSSMPDLPFTLQKAIGNYLLPDYDEMLKIINDEDSDKYSDILEADLTMINAFSQIILSIYNQMPDNLFEDYEKEAVS